MKKTVHEEPETSWSENTTPASDYLGEFDESIEEIERDPPLCLQRSGDVGRGSRFLRSPVQYRARLDLCHKIGVTCSQQSYTFQVMDLHASMDGSVDSSTSGRTIPTSATSSCADPWNSPGFVEEIDDAWNREDEEWLLVPKEEPSEDNINMADVEEPPHANKEAKSKPTIPGKRPRGRPRKHPIISAEDKAKIAKARSKTGCVTCRKRKKKCDERKPGCLNCEKNAVTCEGYPQKTIWKSGKEKAEEVALLRRASIASTIIAPELSPIIHCIETPGDRLFLDHYMTRLSYIFTVDGEQRNAFQDILFPMAIEHSGLMHSLLALSGKHIDFRSPTSLQYLENHPELDVHGLEERARYHDEHAWSDFMEAIVQQNQHDQLVPATVGQMIFLVLQTLADPNPMGAHRPHLEAYQRVIRRTPPGDDDFLRFAKEFFEFHIGLDELISLPSSYTVTECVPILPISNELVVPNFVQREAVRLLGVFDGLFSHMSKITHLRNNVRELMNKGVQAPFDYSIASPALDIHENLQKWKPAWQTGDDSRDLAGILYRQMLVVYLFRTIYPPSPTTWNVREDLIVEVDKGIAMLEKFTPQDRSQTLILAPAFLLGCAAFHEAQRIPIRKAIATVKSYMMLQNSNSALLVLEEVWRLMDAKDPRSWDWQTIAHNMGMDFLAT